MIDETIRPTPFQTGEIISGRALDFPFDSLISAGNEHLFVEAKIAKNDYINELFLLSVMASIYAIRTSSISNEVIDDIIRGLFSSLSMSKAEVTAFIIKNMEEAYPYYVEANQDDLDKPENSDDFSDIDMAFGDRLFHLYGEETEERGNACAHLSMATPKALWVAHFNSTSEALEWSGLHPALQ